MTTTNKIIFHSLEWLIPALIMVESGGDPHAVGDEGKAVGVLQIHPVVVQDCNRLARALYNIRDDHWMLNDRHDEAESKKMCRFYLNYYGQRVEEETGHPPTWQDLARIWNGGPNGYKKHPNEYVESRLQEYTEKVLLARKAIYEANQKRKRKSDVSP